MCFSFSGSGSLTPLPLIVSITKKNLFFVCLPFIHYMYRPRVPSGYATMSVWRTHGGFIKPICVEHIENRYERGRPLKLSLPLAPQDLLRQLEPWTRPIPDKHLIILQSHCTFKYLNYLEYLHFL